MRHGGANNFDVSDVESPAIDTLDGVLDVAGDVLQDYASESLDTRIARMSRWLALNLGGPPYHAETLGRDFQRYDTGEQSYDLVRVGSIFAIQKRDGSTCGLGFGAQSARALAVALLRVAETLDAE